ncbi:MAG: inorganic diphosphatase [Chloroflexi bacterium]|nr:inorganic diphosphatase [Chloroflexota bacterium]
MKDTVTFDIVVEQPFADANTFAYDEHARAIRLDGVARVNDSAWANRGFIFASATPRGEPLRVFLISDAPIPPNVRVEARAVGALEWTRGAMTDRAIVAVPVADARYASARAFNDLPAPHRAAIQRLLERPASARWLDASFADELIHLARQRARLAQVEQREQARARPAWESDSSRSLIDRLARETDLHTQAEAALFLVPYRFQQYLRLCLDPDERILFWAHRPRFSINRVMGIDAFEKFLCEGLLLLTDQQILWMMDSVTPSAGVAGYGYIARSVAVEMLAAIALEEKIEYLETKIASVNKRGAREMFVLEFPTSAREEVTEAARLLKAFLPRANETRLRRVPKVKASRIELDDPMESDRDKTRAIIEQLQSALAPELNRENILAQAFVPMWADGGARLITVSDAKVFVTAQNARKPFDAAFCVNAIASVEICYSVFGSWMRLHVPDANPFEIAFPLTAFKSFNACGRVLRQLSARI